MKVYNRIMLVLGLTGVMLSGCGEDESPNQKEKQLSKLSDTWVVTSATMDDGDVTTDYANFELTLSGSASADSYAYEVVGRPELSPWLTDGTWSFGSDVTTDIIRDLGTADQLLMTYEVSDTQLTLEFFFGGDGYQARVNSASGNWKYTFARK